MLSQKELVLDYMDKFGSISPMQTFSDLGITKLATVVSELIREDGITIYKKSIPCITRLGKRTHYMQYSLKENSNV